MLENKELALNGRIKLELKSGSKDPFSSQYFFGSMFHISFADSVLPKLQFQLLRRGCRVKSKSEGVLRQIH